MGFPLVMFDYIDYQRVILQSGPPKYYELVCKANGLNGYTCHVP